MKPIAGLWIATASLRRAAGNGREADECLARPAVINTTENVLLFVPPNSKNNISHEKSGNHLPTGFLEKYLTSVIENMVSGGASAQCGRTHVYRCSVGSGVFVLLCEKCSISSFIPATFTPRARMLRVFSQRPNMRVFHRCLGWEVWGQSSRVAPYSLSRAPGK